jgi:hypothetical protein
MRVMMKEADVLRQVLDYLAARHVFAFRLGTGRFFGQYKGRNWAFKAHSMGAGAADIMAQLPSGQLCWIEVKGPNRVQRPAQRLFQEWVELQWKHRYLIIHSIDDLVGIV